MKTTAKPVRSQLHNAGANAPVAPISAIALFVQGDIKGGDAANNYRMQVIAGSIREALKGNSRALIEAATFAVGKTKKARAYAAGFAAIGLPNDVPARVQYVGKLDAPENEEARRVIAERLAMYSEQFEFAFCEAFHAPKEPKEPKAPKADDSADNSTDDSAADTVAEIVVPVADVADVVGAAARAVAGGLASMAEVQALEAAIAQYRAGVAILIAADAILPEEAADAVKFDKLSPNMADAIDMAREAQPA